MKLDTIDYQILKLMQEDANITNKINQSNIMLLQSFKVKPVPEP